MATVYCGRCEAEFYVTRTGRKNFDINTGDQGLYCIRVKERMKATGSTRDFDCEFMSDAISVAINSGKI